MIENIEEMRLNLFESAHFLLYLNNHRNLSLVLCAKLIWYLMPCIIFICDILNNYLVGPRFRFSMHSENLVEQNLILSFLILA